MSFVRSFVPATVLALLVLGGLVWTPAPAMAQSPIKVLLLYEDLDDLATDLRDRLLASRPYEAVDLWNLQTSGEPGLEALRGYDAVLHWSGAEPFTSSWQTETLANVLADYVDTGGGLVMGEWWGPFGRLDPYLALAPGFGFYEYGRVMLPIALFEEFGSDLPDAWLSIGGTLIGLPIAWQDDQFGLENGNQWAIAQKDGPVWGRVLGIAFHPTTLGAAGVTTRGLERQPGEPAHLIAAMLARAAAGPKPPATSVAPIVTVPASAVIEATSPSGATFTFAATAMDDIDGAVATTCAPASGDTFPVGVTTVTCEATDSDGNSASANFTVTVQQATATVTNTSPVSATVGGSFPVSATVAPAFATGTVTFTLGAQSVVAQVANGVASGVISPVGASAATLDITYSGDDAVQPATASAQVQFVSHTTLVVNNVSAEALRVATVHAALFSSPGNEPLAGRMLQFEIEGQPAGAAVTNAQGVAQFSWTPQASGTFVVSVTFAGDDVSLASTATVPITVQPAADITAPAVTVPANVTIEATGPGGAPFSFAASATDAVDGAIAVTCSPASGSTFAVGTTTVTCSAADAAGNSASGSFTVTVTVRAPAETLEGVMTGGGFVAGTGRTQFEFVVRERASRGERGRLSLEVRRPRIVNGRARGEQEDSFRGHVVSSVAFSDDPAFEPGRRRAPAADSVVFTGAGEWNGRAGYTFEVRATDQGEPGRRDTFEVVIRDQHGAAVHAAAGTLGGGNIQSHRLAQRRAQRD